ncbi:Gp15 family bacteriophage protein [Marinilabilia salmonicolor]|uniref:Bacteriophage Gp15 protein n=1 Tax=Marinilabilia salmonicolor TaxID=989 RepID=A0A368VC14_9BACT|nr:Gp15 family bacteriophage protein [Marinilabilia salmonicolor]RCW38662.1 bacteriophage Gp15 protein [Marinilabilia salmonicolor]
MESKKITLNGTEYKVKFNFRTFMMFEDMNDKSINNISGKLTDMMSLFYCALKANNKESFEMDYDEFVDKMDDNAEQLNLFSELYNNTASESTDKKRGRPKKKPQNQ